MKTPRLTRPPRRAPAAPGLDEFNECRARRVDAHALDGFCHRLFLLRKNRGEASRSGITKKGELGQPSRFMLPSTSLRCGVPRLKADTLPAPAPWARSKIVRPRMRSASPRRSTVDRYSARAVQRPQSAAHCPGSSSRPSYAPERSSMTARRRCSRSRLRAR